MQRRVASWLIGCGLLALLGCPKPKVWVPPAIDLHEHGTLGLVEFRSTHGYGPMATRRFLAYLHGAQSGVPVLELGPLEQVLRAVGHAELGREAVRAIGEKYGVDTLVVGDLEIELPKPSFSLHSFTEASATAEIHGHLNARLLQTRSGATIWSEEARGKRTLAAVDMALGQRPDFGAVDPEGEQLQLVAWLVARSTDDFRGRWVRP